MTLNFPSVEDYSSLGSCITPMVAEVADDEFSTHVLVTGFSHITAREMITTSRARAVYSEVSITPCFGLHLFRECRERLKLETDMLSQRFSNPFFIECLSRITESIPDKTRAKAVEEAALVFIRANRQENTQRLFYYDVNNTLVIHIKGYVGLDGKPVIGMECLKRALAVVGVKQLKIHPSSPVYIEVPLLFF